MLGQRGRCTRGAQAAVQPAAEYTMQPGEKGIGKDAPTRIKINQALLRYCELDTLAMVMIVQGWRDLLDCNSQCRANTHNLGQIEFGLNLIIESNVYQQEK